jgi:hypothetical protein
VSARVSLAAATRWPARWSHPTSILPAQSHLLREFRGISNLKARKPEAKYPPPTDLGLRLTQAAP